ncbi:hypothetical protein FRC08_016463 [Ceratobasidium sp. 394]|nr:hypothetical protein FRC08_016463 [Ceratobasidium sp. 394]
MEPGAGEHGSTKFRQIVVFRRGMVAFPKPGARYVLWKWAEDILDNPMQTLIQWNEAEGSQCCINNGQMPTVIDEKYANATKVAFDNKCTAVETVPGTYDSHWWSGNLPAPAMAPPGLQYPFEYNRTLNQRVRTDLLYQSLTAMNLRFIGDAAVVNGGTRPGNAPFVSRPAMPKWYPTELGYRITATTQVPTGQPIQTAQYPDTVRNLITTNSARIHTGGLGKTWIGMNKVFPDKYTPPYPNIQVGYDTRMTMWQSGGAGPFSVEAAFIIATQVAGVNFKAVAKAIQQSGKIETWWTGVLMPGRNVRAFQCFNEQAIASGERLYGNPMAKPDANDHNVFVMIIHAMDANSVYQIANDNYLRNVVLTPYTPSQGKSDAKFWGPQGSRNEAPPLPPPNPNANTRQV